MCSTREERPLGLAVRKERSSAKARARAVVRRKEEQDFRFLISLFCSLLSFLLRFYDCYTKMNLFSFMFILYYRRQTWLFSMSDISEFHELAFFLINLFTESSNAITELTDVAVRDHSRGANLRDSRALHIGPLLLLVEQLEE